MRTSRPAHPPAADPPPPAAGAPWPDRDTLIPMGEIINSHGTRGEVRVRLFNPASTALTAARSVVLQRGSERQERRVLGARRNKHLALLVLDGCDSMLAAKGLSGWQVCVPAHELPPAPPGEVYHHELVGMEVVTVAGALIGTVTAMMPAPSVDVCVVHAGRREHLIPLVADIVRQIDRGARRIVIEPIPGLLDP